MQSPYGRTPRWPVRRRDRDHWHAHVRDGGRAWTTLGAPRLRAHCARAGGAEVPLTAHDISPGPGTRCRPAEIMLGPAPRRGVPAGGWAAFSRLALIRTSTIAGPMELDHVLFAVADLAAAATEFESRYGLASVQGGRHDGWGTANRIVPLGDAYLELLAVVDEDEAASSVSVAPRRRQPDPLGVRLHLVRHGVSRRQSRLHLGRRAGGR